MKKIFVFILLILLTGCTCEYEIELKKDEISEKTIFNINDDEIYDFVEGTSSGDNPKYIIDSDFYPLVNNKNIKYDKSVEQNDNYKIVTLKYVFSYDDYKNLSYVMKNCFENISFVETDNGYKIHLTGAFYCMYDDEITINIKDNNISKANGLKNNDKYTWVIDSSNYNNVDIQIETSYENNIRQYIFIAIAIIFGIGLLLFIIYVVGNIMGRDSINSI